MRCLPFAMTRGPWFTQVMQEARQDPRRSAMCPSCGSQMTIEPDKAQQRVRCPSCARWQSAAVEQDVPWRLTPDAAQALRRTRTWLRRV